VVLKLKVSQLTDVAEEIQEPMADQVTKEPELSLCVFLVLFTFNKCSEFLTSLVICIRAAVGLWRMDFECFLW